MHRMALKEEKMVQRMVEFDFRNFKWVTPLTALGHPSNRLGSPLSEFDPQHWRAFPVQKLQRIGMEWNRGKIKISPLLKKPSTFRFRRKRLSFSMFL